MLSPEKNEILVRTGPCTPMGDLFRRYWIPVMCSDELGQPDCPPVRVSLLSEQLLAFRDSEGRPGLVSEFCVHRRASLFFGRNEACGLRCAYHGWKYDISGTCVDLPSEPADSNTKDRVKITAYPCRERGGVVWAYLGPSELEPQLPELEWALVPDEQRFISRRIQESNYMQGMEGGIDSSHIAFAHGYSIEDDPMHSGTAGHGYLTRDTHPRFEVAESDGGLLIGARRIADQSHYYWRITQWIMPWYTLIPPFGTHNVLGAHAWVPLDDENCWMWSINFHPTRPLEDSERAAMRQGKGIHAACIPGTHRAVANRDNDYLIDRDAQRRKETFSGVKGLSIQDSSLQESMGRIVDRSQERLGTSDVAIVRARRRLLGAVESVATDGRPPGIDPVSQRVRSASIVIPQDEPFTDARDALTVKPGKDVASV